MKRIFALFILLIPGVVFAQTGYRLGSGDLISITVFGEPDLTMEVRVGDAATFSYPFLGQITILDRPVSAVENEIIEGLKGDYLIEPRVSVSVKEYRPFFISGEVANPGGYPYQPGLNLQKAISLGGGLTERASRNRMYVNRGGAGEARQRIDMGDPVFPDDVITIEQSFF